MENILDKNTNLGNYFWSNPKFFLYFSGSKPIRNFWCSKSVFLSTFDCQPGGRKKTQAVVF
jgi:hypothetical protein